jgi:hypothetical protein
MEATSVNAHLQKTRDMGRVRGRERGREGGGNIEGGRGIYINECRDGGKGRY